MIMQLGWFYLGSKLQEGVIYSLSVTTSLSRSGVAVQEPQFSYPLDWEKILDTNGPSLQMEMFTHKYWSTVKIHYNIQNKCTLKTMYNYISPAGFCIYT